MENIIRVPTEIWSRVTGYFRPVHNWNEGKQQEKKDRNERTEEDVKKFLKKATK